VRVTPETRKCLHAFQANNQPPVKRVIIHKAWDYIPSYGIVLFLEWYRIGIEKKGPKKYKKQKTPQMWGLMYLIKLIV
tara:strand:- start:97 stop:330 length:234 start_codon:yes stop_codon:yes gene_type:complete